MSRAMAALAIAMLAPMLGCGSSWRQPVAGAVFGAALAGAVAQGIQKGTPARPDQPAVARPIAPAPVLPSAPRTGGCVRAGLHPHDDAERCAYYCLDHWGYHPAKAGAVRTYPPAPSSRPPGQPPPSANRPGVPSPSAGQPRQP